MVGSEVAFNLQRPINSVSEKMTTKVSQALLLPAPRLNLHFVMQQISANPKVTQAELAQKCSLSVAMVNNYMKELCARGFVDYHRKSSRSISYYLTEPGKAAVAAMGQEYMQTLLSLFEEAKDRIRQIVLGQGGPNINRVVLYGTGDLAELAFHALESMGIAVIGVCRGSEPRERDWCGRELLNPTQILFLAPDAIILADRDQSKRLFQSFLSIQDGGIRLIRLLNTENDPSFSKSEDQLLGTSAFI
jgi:predicted transcriptional regulator